MHSKNNGQLEPATHDSHAMAAKAQRASGHACVVDDQLPGGTVIVVDVGGAPDWSWPRSMTGGSPGTVQNDHRIMRRER